MIGRTAGWVDELIARTVVEPRFVARRPVERVSVLRERLDAMRDLTEDDWFVEPQSLEPAASTEGRYHGRTTRTLMWTLPMVPAAQRLGTSPRTVEPCCTLYGSQGKGVWILLHGWLGGMLSRDRRLWPFDALLERYDLLQLTLPGHGPRRVRGGGLWPSFPGRNPVANAIGLALATAELRQVIRWLKGQGYAHIGVAATSVGANVAALLVTLHSACARVLLDRPLVRMSEPLRRVAARHRATLGEPLALLERIYAPVDPLLRPQRMARDCIDILLGQHDYIAGAESGLALAQHWGLTPTWFAGGHVLPVGRWAAMRPMFDKLMPRL